MINSITVTNHLGEAIKLELRFPEKSGFLVQDVTGLGPSKADIKSTELSSGDGSVFNSARVGARNIVMTLKFLELPSIEETRQRSYKYFPLKKRIRLVIESDRRSAEIYGYIESNDPIIFGNSVSTTISIICPNPYFYSLDTTTTVLAGIEDQFSFPFSTELDQGSATWMDAEPWNDAEPWDETTSMDGSIPFGEIVVSQERVIEYSGDSEIGIRMSIHAIGPATDIAIYNTGTRESMIIDTDKLAALTGSAIVAGDDIFISTIKGDKYITLLRGGVYTNVLNCLAKDTDWFQLSKGENVFAIVVGSGGSDLQFKIENQTVYEGV